MIRRHFFLRVVPVVLACAIAPRAYAVDVSSGAIPLLASSSKVDAAVQRWAGLGASGSVRVIVSAQAGQLGIVKTLLTLLGLPLLGELPGINAVVVQVNALTLPALAC